MLFLGIYQKKETRILHKELCTSVLSSFIHKSKLWRKARSHQQRMDKRGGGRQGTLPLGKTNEALIGAPAGRSSGTRHGGTESDTEGYTLRESVYMRP